MAVQFERQDSTRVEIREKTVYVHDTVYFEVPIQTAERTTRDTSSHLENDYAESEARINQDGTLYHDLKTKPGKKTVPVDVPQIQKDSIVYKDRIVKEIEQVPRDLSPWQKWQIRSSWILLSGLVIFILRKPLLAIIRRFI